MAQILFWGTLSLAVSGLGETKLAVKDITFKDFIGLVLQRNESVQERILEFETNRRRFKGEQGTFEPELVLGYNRVENEQQNTAQQRRSTGVSVFTEKTISTMAGWRRSCPPA